MNWKSAAEFLGIAAIVASLMFVGRQIQQDRQFAEAQAIEEMLQNRLSLRADANEFMHILTKGNSGAQLDETESLIVQNIVRNEHDLVLLQLFQAQAIGTGSIATNTPELELAVFLYQNPAAKKAWLQITAERTNLADALRSPESLSRTRESGSAALRARITAYLADLEELSSK